MRATKVRSIYVAGSGMRGNGYPNASQTLRILRKIPGLKIHDQARWLPEGTTLWNKAGARGTAAIFLAKLMWLNALEALRVVRQTRGSTACVYIPYPAVFLLWWMSWVPASLRPRLIADAYVSLWDAAFRDRNVAKQKGFLSRVFRRFESRAMRAADTVLVDTIANRDWFISDLGVDASRIRAIPLAINAHTNGTDAAASGSSPRLRVLFIGTLVPLHGIAVIADAVQRLLAEGFPMDFTFVGNGQDSVPLENLLAGSNAEHVTWQREWASQDSLLNHIRQADICLGVFGGGGKAARVLPLKIYLALSEGKAVVTQDCYSLPESVPEPPVYAVPPDENNLAEALKRLSANREAIVRLSTASKAYFEEYLSDKSIATAWIELLSRVRTK